MPRESTGNERRAGVSSRLGRTATVGLMPQRALQHRRTTSERRTPVPTPPAALSALVSPVSVRGRAARPAERGVSGITSAGGRRPSATGAHAVPSVRYGRSWLGLVAVATLLGFAAVVMYGLSAAAAVGALGVVGLAYMAWIEPARPRLEHRTLFLLSLPAELDGLRIGQITDAHLGMPFSTRNLCWAVAQLQRERPEVVVLTGDFVSRAAAIAGLTAGLEGVRAPLGVYAVPGNHDYREGLTAIRQALAELNIPLLINAQRRLCWQGTELWLVGLDDGCEGEPDLERALVGVPPGACTVLLAHAPDVADVAAAHGVNVQLSGHTHGGHLRLPLLGPLALPPGGWRYAMGHYQVGALQLYVSRGLGGTPVRLGCRPEVTILTLRRGSPPARGTGRGWRGAYPGWKQRP